MANTHIFIEDLYAQTKTHTHTRTDTNTKTYIHEPTHIHENVYTIIRIKHV